MLLLLLLLLFFVVLLILFYFLFCFVFSCLFPYRLCQNLNCTAVNRKTVLRQSASGGNGSSTTGSGSSEKTSSGRSQDLCGRCHSDFERYARSFATAHQGKRARGGVFEVFSASVKGESLAPFLYDCRSIISLSRARLILRYILPFLCLPFLPFLWSLMVE